MVERKSFIEEYDDEDYKKNDSSNLEFILSILISPIVFMYFFITGVFR